MMMRKYSIVMKRIMRTRITSLHGRLHLSQDVVDQHCFLIRSPYARYVPVKAPTLISVCNNTSKRHLEFNRYELDKSPA